MEVLLTPTEIAERWHVRRAHIYRLLRANALPSIHLGRRSVRVPQSALEAFVAAGGWRGRPTENGQAA